MRLRADELPPHIRAQVEGGGARSAITVTIDGDPVAKGRPRVTRAGIAFTPAKTRAFEAHARMAAQIAMDGRDPIEGPVAVVVVAVMPIPMSYSRKKAEAALAGATRPAKRPDIENVAKAAFDALNGIVYRDDSQIVEMVARKVYGLRPRVEVTVMGWGGDGA